MKLVIALVLTALPFYCYAGSGCQVLEHAIDATIDPSVDENEYVNEFREFLTSKEDENAARELKKCFLKQNHNTLRNFKVMMEKIYNSFWCAPY